MGKRKSTELIENLKKVAEDKPGGQKGASPYYFFLALRIAFRYQTRAFQLHHTLDKIDLQLE